MSKDIFTGTYTEAVGRRKTSTARVRLFASDKETIFVNEKELTDYFPTNTLQETVRNPLKKAGLSQSFAISVHVNGGGLSSQAQAVRHGISRALVELNEETHGVLKKAGFLKRDPRMKERKKFGLRKARRAPQWSKR